MKKQDTAYTQHYKSEIKKRCRDFCPQCGNGLRDGGICVDCGVHVCGDCVGGFDNADTSRPVCNFCWEDRQERTESDKQESVEPDGDTEFIIGTVPLSSTASIRSSINSRLINSQNSGQGSLFAVSTIVMRCGGKCPSLKIADGNFNRLFPFAK